MPPTQRPSSAARPSARPSPSTVAAPTPAPTLFRSIINLVRSLLLDRRYFWHFTALLLLGEAALGLLIIWKIPYTKIDWPAYMQQVDMFLDGERDYSRIQGETGPLVYPALHLYIYTAFHHLLPSIDDVRPAQYVFLVFYLLTLLLVAGIYYLAGRSSASSATSSISLRHFAFPQALLIPLALSKRLHSIFMLRLFNDPIAMLIFYAAVVVIMLDPGSKKGWRIGCLLYSLALGVKMNILLFLPGLLVLLFQYRGLYGTLESVALIASVQLALPAPFFLSLSNARLTKAYFTSAFDLSRQFLYEWTVNWRFIDEKMFLSRERAVGLLIGQLSLLVAFAIWRWSPVPGGVLRVVQNGFQRPSQASIRAAELPSYHIPLTLFTCNLIGILFARSLHYQFHSWYFHQIPFLLVAGGAWRSIPLGVALWTTIEWAWATFPSTVYSSGALLLAHIVILGGLWVRTPCPIADAQGKVQ